MHGFYKRRARDQKMRELQQRIQSDDNKSNKNVQRDVQRIWYSGAWRSPESIIRKRSAQNIRKREHYAANAEAINAARRADRATKSVAESEEEKRKSREYYQRNKGRENERRAKWARQNRERQLANQRAAYHRKRAERLAAIYEGRDRRNPSRIIRRALKQYSCGLIGHAEFVAQVRRATDAFNGGNSDGRGSGCGSNIENPRGAQSPASAGGDPGSERDHRDRAGERESS